MFENEVKRDPKNISFLIQLVKLYIHQGKVEQATQVYEEAIEGN